MLARARREPRALVIGMDAAAAAMAEGSLRAARPGRKGGLPNALFVVAAAERPPAELAGIAGLVAPGGVVRMLVSIDPRDRLAVPVLAAADRAAIAARWACHGLILTAFARARRDEIEASDSSWSRRLGAGRERAVWRLELRRADRPDRRTAVIGGTGGDR